MSTLKLLLPGGRSITLGSPFRKEKNKLAGLSLIVNVISLTAVSLFAFLLPLSGTLLYSDTETSALKFLLIFVFIFLIILIVKLFIQGNSFVIDPKGMLMILVFNLILTTLSIAITTVRVSNTFGTTGFRYLSGLALMSLIGLFYFVNLYASNNVALRRILNLISAGSFAYIVSTLLLSNQTVNQFIGNLPLITVGFAILIYRVLISSRKRLGSVLVLAAGLLILLATTFNNLTYASLFWYSIVLFIASTLVLALYALKNKKNIKSRFAQIRANISNFISVKKVSIPTSKGLSDLHLVVILILPLILLITSIFFYIKIPAASKADVFMDIFNQYSEGLNIISAGSNSINGSNIRSLLMGVGSDNYNPSRSFFVNVFVISGFIGGAIYLFLWLYFIKSAKDLFSRSIKERKDFKLRGLLLFSTLLLPLMLLISYSNLTTVILLWVIYAIVSSMQSNISINYLDNGIDSSAKKNLRTMILKTVATIILLVGVIYSMSVVFGVLK